MIVVVDGVCDELAAFDAAAIVDVDSAAAFCCCYCDCCWWW